MATSFRQWNDDFVVENQQKTVSININGEFENSKVLHMDPEWTLQDFLSASSQRLNLFPTASRLFNADGVEIDDCMMIVDDDLLFLSNGANFVPPTAKQFVNGSGYSGDMGLGSDMLDGTEDTVPSTIGGYMVGKVLGRGAFGEVRVGEHHLTNERVALKYLRKCDILSIGAAERTAIEVQCLGALKHNNIIRLHTQLESPSHVVIVFELMEGGDLSGYLNARGNTPAEMALSEEDARPLFHQILSAVGYAHNQHICHRDLKLENILLKYVDSLSVVKVADFGLSDFYRPGVNKKSYCGTLAFLAPEVFKGTSNAGPPLDIWSMGVILFAILCGRLPFDPSPSQLNDTNKTREQIIRQKIIACQYKIDEKLGPEAKDLVRRMLKVDPTERASIPEIFNHVWLRPISNTLIDFTPTVTVAVAPTPTPTNSSHVRTSSSNGGVAKVTQETPTAVGDSRRSPSLAPTIVSSKGVGGSESSRQASRDNSFNPNESVACTAQFTPHLLDSIDIIANSINGEVGDVEGSWIAGAGAGAGRSRPSSRSKSPDIMPLMSAHSSDHAQVDDFDDRMDVSTPLLSTMEPIVSTSFSSSNPISPASFKLVPLRRQVGQSASSRDQMDELDELYVNINQALVSQSLTDSLTPPPGGRNAGGGVNIDLNQRPYSTQSGRNVVEFGPNSRTNSGPNSRAFTPDLTASVSGSRVMRSKLRNEQLAASHALGSGSALGLGSIPSTSSAKYTTTTTTSSKIGGSGATGIGNSPKQKHRSRAIQTRQLRSFTTDATETSPPDSSNSQSVSYNSTFSASGRYSK